MKNTLLFLCLLCTTSTFAQDKLTLKNGITKDIIIIKVDDTLLTFRYPYSDPIEAYTIPLDAVMSYEKGSPLPPQDLKAGEILPIYEEIEPIRREIYCQVIATGKIFFTGNKRSQIRIDYGFDKTSEATYDKAILKSVDDGRAFTSIADALNYMSLKKGWTLVSSHSSSIESKNFQYFIMKKTVTLTPEKETEE